MTDLFNQLKYKYRNSNLLVKIIFINAFVFLAIATIGLITKLFYINQVNIFGFLGVTADLKLLARKIWTPFTYMFIHADLLHIFFNMLWLYWFGRIFLQYFSNRTLVSLYIMGGVCGALTYILAFNTIPYYVNMLNGWKQMQISPPLIGASAAVMAIVMGAAFYRPKVRINLLFLGSINIKYIALVIFILDFLALGKDANPGGHLAHIGGGLIGYIFAIQYKKGRDITAWLGKMIDIFTNLFKPVKKSKLKVTYKRSENNTTQNRQKSNDQEIIDAILDKLKQSGYSSLSADEKKKLFDASKK